VEHKFRRVLIWIHRFFHLLVRLIFVLVLLIALLFIYLRTVGLPDFILNKVMQRIHAAGVPISVERVILTMGGWQANGVRYYSENPDDLDPLFFVKTVDFSILKNPDGSGMTVDVDMSNLLMTPSSKWKIKIPPNSEILRLSQIKGILKFSPKEILLLDAETKWLDFSFHINGKVLKGEKSYVPEGLNVKSSEAFSFSEEQFKALENQLKIFNLSKGVDVNIDFVVDTEKYTESRLDFSLLSENISIKKIPFSQVEIKGSVTDPLVQLDRAVLFQGQKSIQLSGNYNWITKQSKIWLFNSIVSTNLLTFIPPKTRTQITDFGLVINELPQFDLTFGPVIVSNLLNDVQGSFSLRDVVYQGLTIDRVQANIKRIQRRLEINDIQANVLGQEQQADEKGTCLRGGAATGRLFWDENSREFGVEGDMNFDPNLLLGPLKPVKIATEIIDYFKFKSVAPNAHVELGAMVDNWGTFYLTINGTAQNGLFRGVKFSSLNTKAVYKEYKLRLDPLSILQGTAFLKGSSSIDFDHSTAEFEGSTTLNPADLEAAIYPSSLQLFSNKVKLNGNIRLSGEGIVDWSTSMSNMNFKATIQADHIEIPVGKAKNITATVIGNGPSITVKNAKFSICSGSGNGDFRIHLNALPNSIPYKVDAQFSKINFKNILMRYTKDPIHATGELSGSAHIKADMATHFFDTATGQFSIKIKEGKLADLPLFKEFSKAIRFIIPKFNALSITQLYGHFNIANGKISSKEVLFSGNVISAVGRGSYSPKSGFNALVQTRILKKKGILGIVDFVTSPFTKLFEMHLTGTLDKPSWSLGTFTKLKE